VLVTIVTIVKDNLDGLKRTFSSILLQEVHDWELVIVAGASADGSLEFSEKLAEEYSKVSLIRQEGVGIFPAMNLGLEEATGQFIWFMNSGDEFASSRTIELALTELKNSSVGLVIGGYQIGKNNFAKKFSFPRCTLKPFEFAFSRRGGCHQAMLFNTSDLKLLGGYNLSYKFNSDFELVLKVIELSGGLRVPEIYAVIEPGGVADQNLNSVHSEKHKIRVNFFDRDSVWILSLLWTIAARFKISIRKLVNAIILNKFLKNPYFNHI